MCKFISQSAWLCRKKLIGCFALSFFVVSAVALGETVTPIKQALLERECVAIALSHPLWKRMWQNREAQARAGVRIAGRWHNPGLGIEREKVGQEKETIVTVSQTFEFGHRGARKQAAKYMLDATRSTVSQLRRERSMQVRLLFYQTLQRKQRIEAHRAWLSRLKQSRFSGNDFRWVSREAALARAQMRSERAAYQRDWQRLRVVLGEAEKRFDRVSGQLFPSRNIPALETVLAGIQRRPDIEALGKKAEAYLYQQRASGRVGIPDLTVGIGRKTIENNTTKDSGSVVSLSLSWPIGNRGKGHRLQSQAREQTARTRQQLLLMQARGETQGLWYQARELRSAYLEYSRVQRLHTPQRLVRSAETGYRLGRLNINNVLQAYRNVLQSRLQLIDMAFAVRKVQIELALVSAGGV